MTRVQQLARGVMLLAVTTGAAGVVAATQASAASCSAITISAGQNLTFNVSSVYVTKGACVRFANLTDVTVTIKVSGSSFSTRLPARTPSSASPSFTAERSAAVTASDGVRTGRGYITVEKAQPSATPTPTPTQSQIIPTNAPSSSATPTTKTKHVHNDVPVSGGVPTDAPAAVNTNTATGFGDVVAPVPPPVDVSGAGSTSPPAASHPVVAPRVKSSDPRLTSTVLEPASGPRRGLPAMVAVVLLVGLAAAYGRTVLVAGEAVDRRAVHRPIRPTV